jgi:hypothetical protein
VGLSRLMNGTWSNVPTLSTPIIYLSGIYSVTVTCHLETAGNMRYRCVMARTPNPIPSTNRSVKLPDTLWEALAELRVADQLPTVTEAIRVLLLEAIEARAVARKRKAKP